MALPNNDPIYSRSGDVQSSNTGLTATNVAGFVANTSQDGSSSSTSMYAVYQADATNGGYLQRLIFESVGSPALTVARVYLCSVTGALTIGTSNTSQNTWKINEVQLPAVTLSQTVNAPHIELPINMAIPPGYRILVSFGTSTGGAATTGWTVVAVAGKY